MVVVVAVVVVVVVRDSLDEPRIVSGARACDSASWPTTRTSGEYDRRDTPASW